MELTKNDQIECLKFLKRNKYFANNDIPSMLNEIDISADNGIFRSKLIQFMIDYLVPKENWQVDKNPIHWYGPDIPKYGFSKIRFKTDTLIIDNTINSLAEGTFSYASGYTTVIFNNSILKEIPVMCFIKNDYLQKIVLENSAVASISEKAFYDIQSIEEIKFNSNTPTIFDYMAFANCVNLTKINLPDRIISLRKFAFSNVPGITQLNLDHRTGILYDSSLYSIPNLKVLNINFSINNIEQHAILRCARLEKIYFKDVSELKFIGFNSVSFRTCHPDLKIYYPKEFIQRVHDGLITFESEEDKNLWAPKTPKTPNGHGVII